MVYDMYQRIKNSDYNKCSKKIAENRICSSGFNQTCMTGVTLNNINEGQVPLK